MNTTEKNEIIRKFVGLETTKESFGGKPFYNVEDLQKVGINFSPGAHGNGTTELKFHSSWDWLMVVVEKIGTLNESESIQLKAIEQFKHCSIFSPLKAVYFDCLDFIEWYEIQQEIKHIVQLFDFETLGQLRCSGKHLSIPSLLHEKFETYNAHVIVFLERGTHSELIATFDSEEEYQRNLLTIKAIAEIEGCNFSEQINN